MSEKSDRAGRSGSNRPGADGDSWSAVVACLNAGQYARAVEILQEMRRAAKEQGSLVQAKLLQATTEICRTASQNLQEMELHRKACEEALSLDEQLQTQLHAIIELCTQGQTAGGYDPAAESAELDRSVAGGPRPVDEGKPSLWQRVKGKLGRPEPLAPIQQKGQMVRGPIPAPDPLSEAGSADRPRSSPSESMHTENPPSAGLRPAAARPRTASRGSKRPPRKDAEAEPALPFFNVYCLGRFEAYQDDVPIVDWSSNKGNAIFKYLVAHREQPTAKEVLMELFWPEAEPDSARNSLNVAIYSLRQCLRETRPDFSHILFHAGAYLLSPELEMWIDFEEFLAQFSTALKLERSGTLSLAIREYHAAETLYQGEFLEEDRYEEWILPYRQNLRDTYLRLLERLRSYYMDRKNYDACSMICRKALAIDACLEDVHCCLMRCYQRQGQRYLALRQYHLCVEALSRELLIDPSSATRALYHRIRES